LAVVPVAPDQRTNNGLIDSMSATCHKCLHIASKLSPEIVIAAYRYGRKYGIEPELLLAMAFVESSFNPHAVNHGCYGVYQINYHIWHKVMALNPYKLLEIDYNTEAACQILSGYIARCNGDVFRAVHWFNNGPSGKYNNRKYVLKVRKFYRAMGGVR